MRGKEGERERKRVKGEGYNKQEESNLFTVLVAFEDTVEAVKVVAIGSVCCCIVDDDEFCCLKFVVFNVSISSLKS